MNTRRMVTADEADVREIHAHSPSKYGLPDKMLVGRAVVDDDNFPRICLMARKTAEIYLVLDHDYETPAWRMEAVKVLIQEVKGELEGLGYTDAYAFLGDDVPRSYMNRLMRLGARKMVVTCLHFLKGEL